MKVKVELDIGHIREGAGNCRVTLVTGKRRRYLGVVNMMPDEVQALCRDDWFKAWSATVGVTCRDRGTM